jgi:hypothetical protein
MRDLPTFLSTQQAISIAAHGRQRHPSAAVGQAHGALQRAGGDPQGLYSWVDLIFAGIEGALRSGATPFAIAEALISHQGRLASTRFPPHLAKHSEFIEQRNEQRAKSLQEEYGV